MEIHYSEFVSTLAERTIANYEYIRNRSEEDKLFEVTQLINSLYCLLVVPQGIFGHSKNGAVNNTDFAAKEKYLRSKHEEYSELKGLIDILYSQNRLKYVVKEEFDIDCPVSSFIDKIRNALCHDGIGFLPISEENNGKTISKIDDIIFMTKSTSGRVKFVTVMTVRQLEKLAYCLMNMYKQVEEGKRSSDEKRYKELFKSISDTMQQELGEYSDCVKADTETFDE